MVLCFLWWDAFLAFKFTDGFGIGIGTVILLANALLLSLYSLPCHSCRHLCGGKLNLFSKAPLRYRSWKVVTWLNEHHTLYAWISLVWVAFTDLYVCLVATGRIYDVRLF